WWRQLQYIGDAKSGRLVGTDRFGNRYFENLNAEEEIPGRHRWVDLAQHEYNISQVPPEWHSWISHIRKEPPTEDGVMQKMTPAWKAVRKANWTNDFADTNFPPFLFVVIHIAVLRELDRDSRRVSTL
ncbi:hypothetical protein FRC20_007051, partial [Serendipita sp. 405]